MTEQEAARLERQLRNLGFNVREGAFTPVRERLAPATRTLPPTYQEREMVELHRRIDAAGPNADVELIVVNM